MLSKLTTKVDLILYYLELNFISASIAILDFEEQNKKKALLIANKIINVKRK